MTAKQELLEMFEDVCRIKMVPFARAIVDDIIEIYMETDIEECKRLFKKHAGSEEDYEKMVDLITRIKKELN